MRVMLFSAIILCGSVSGCKNTVQTRAVENEPAGEEALNGTWELDVLEGRILQELYPQKRPVIIFDTGNNAFNGSTGCNTFHGELKLDGEKIDFAAPIAVTKMMCPGEGESVFLEALKKVNSYFIDDKALTFIAGDIAVMRFLKQ